MGVFTVTLLVLGVVVYEKFKNDRELEFDRSLYNYSLDAAHAINIDVFGGVSFDVDSLIGNGKSFPFAIGHSFVQLVKRDGHIIGKSRDLGADTLLINPAILKTVSQDHFFLSTLNFDDLPHQKNFPRAGYRQLSLLVGSPQVPNFILQIAVPRTYLVQEKQKFTQGFFIAIPVVLIVSLLGGIYLSRRAFVPIQEIIKKATLIDPHNLDERLPLPPTNDELYALSSTLNDLLERIQKVFVSQERFIADASHQLKTPIAILRGEVEIALKKSRSVEELQELLVSQSLELGFLTRVIDNLLLLARVEGGVAFLTKTPVRLDEIVIDGVSRHEKLARERGVQIKLDLDHSGLGGGPFIVQGDEDLLKSLVSEMLSNAIKYSPENELVGVKVSDRNESVTLDFIDKGHGITSAESEKIFERFFRGQDVSVQGSGLGLSIAKKIAEIHGGKISYLNLGPHSKGSQFSIEIKKV